MGQVYHFGGHPGNDLFVNKNGRELVLFSVFSVPLNLKMMNFRHDFCERIGITLFSEMDSRSPIVVEDKLRGNDIEVPSFV